MKKMTYFVPVDFSSCSYNALQYAAMLARFAAGTLKIVHVLDLNDLPESDNQVVVTWRLDQLYRKAEAKMKSLKEIISVEGVEAEAEIVAGKLHMELLKQVDKVQPQVIVIGRDDQKRISKGGVISFLTKNTTVPVLVVPGSHSPKIPNNAMLVTDMSYQAEDIAPLLSLLQKTAQRISVLPIGNGSKLEQSIKWMEDLKDRFELEVKLISAMDLERKQAVQEFIRNNQVDIVCTIKQRNGFFKRFFKKDTTDDLSHADQLPVLVYNR